MSSPLPRRLWHFLDQTTRPAITGPYLMGQAALVYLGLGAAAGHRPPALDGLGLCAVLSVPLFAFLLRVYDDIKDADADRRLGNQGDGRYATRALVTGAVSLEDVANLRWFLTMALIALNLPLLGTIGFVVFGVTFVLFWLSFKWFFWPRISRSLLLALVTHNPLLLVLLGYVAGVFVAGHGWADIESSALFLIVGLWLTWTAWETARKIRRPEDETDYETYSKVFGRAAPLVPSVIVLTSFLALSAFALRIGLGWAVVITLLAPALLFVLRAFSFLVAPTRSRANLQPFADLYGIAATVIMLGALVATLGVDWR